MFFKKGKSKTINTLVILTLRYISKADEVNISYLLSSVYNQYYCFKKRGYSVCCSEDCCVVCKVWGLTYGKGLHVEEPPCFKVGKGIT